MINIIGVKLTEIIAESAETVIYRGWKEATPVIVKTINKEYPTLTEMARIKHEYEILKILDIPGVVKCYGLEKYQNSLAIILEDVGGKSLKEKISRGVIKLVDSLRISVQIIEAIGEVHKNRIIHKDIKPKNIIISGSETNKVKLIDFSIASQLDKETQTGGNPKLLEGTLAYMSPEQTGRMNRAIDYRTDFYSLGVTIYEMLTGQLPFQATDALELIHCHIAKTPIPPHELNPEIPEAVSAIVMKLLAKNAEDRYQSAKGIKADLDACMTMLLKDRKIEKFSVGSQDVSEQFEIPQKLYGREREVLLLMDAFSRVSGGSTEMMLVAGYSGIGKSMLVNEIHKPIVRQRGYFIAGKFDQYKRNIPYASLVQAFRQLMGQLLTESSSQLQRWKEKLAIALGANGQVIIDVIPELELIIGKQPAVVQLGAAEAQNRFNLVVKNFIHVFTQKEHPLVLFLDDLQWADSASLKLIQLLMTDPDGQYLLMLGAYRDNEVSPTHPFMLTLDEIFQAGGTVSTITINPLAIDCIKELIADTLNCTPAAAIPLAELLLQKTGGNPFFLTQLLKYLYLESFLVFNFTTSRWEWDVEQIHKINVTDNVVELMIAKLQKLPKNTQDVLKLAACVGNRFNLHVLSVVNEKSLSATAADLWEALRANLIVPLSDAYKVPRVLEEFDELVVDYKFLHDRVQQAAYALIPEERKKEVHLKVGQLLLQNSSPSEREENIFDIVNQLNIGAELIASRAEKDELATLNLIAGRKAKAATAYEAARNYLTVGLELLAAGSWQVQYDLALTLHVEAVEVEYLSTNFPQAQALSEIVLEKATSLLDRVKVYELQIQFYIAENQMVKALDTGLPVIEMLGFPVVQESSALSLVAKLPALADLENIPEMTDPVQLAALRLMTILAGPAFIGKPEILPFIAFRTVNLCLEHGNSPLAACAYGLYGLLSCGPLADIETGYHCGQLSLQLLEQFNARELKCKVYHFFNDFIRHWKENIREKLAEYTEAIQNGLETGNLVYASYCSICYCPYLFFIGEQLDYVESKHRQYAELLLKVKQEHGFYALTIWRKVILNLQNLAKDNALLFDESFDEANLHYFREINNRTLLFFTYFAKLILSYLFKHYEAAVVNAKIAAEYESSATASMFASVYKFYDSLALLSWYPQVDSSDREQYLQRISSNQQLMQEWAVHAACNFQHKYELVEAEKARVLGDELKAIAYYDRAISNAREYGYIQDEALANELAAEFYLACGREKVAKVYMTDAYYGYSRWGAVAKVRDLDAIYPQLIFRTSPQETISIATPTTTTSTGGSAAVLDLASVLKSSQAIAGEILLDKLLVKLIKVIVENAGAQKGFLILEEGGTLKIEATGEVDKDAANVLRSIPVDSSQELPAAIVHYVARTNENVVLSDATNEGLFTGDTYIINNQVKSVLCAPLLNQGQLTGIVYLENNLTKSAFTPTKLEIVQLLSGQAAIAIDNARLYNNLELKVLERTQQLSLTLDELKATQQELIQKEKMAALGQLVAGIAHEINTPIGAIRASVSNIISAFNSSLEQLPQLLEQLPANQKANFLALLNRLKNHQQSLSSREERQLRRSLKKELETYGFENADTLAEKLVTMGITQDITPVLPLLQDSQGDLILEVANNFSSQIRNSDNILLAVERASKIVFALKTYIRQDSSGEMVKANIPEGIDIVLTLYQAQLRQGIEVVKEYEGVPDILCYPDQLNQVWTNLIYNGIQAMNNRGQLEIKVFSQAEEVVVQITDSGCGIPPEIKEKIFEPFFTTKPAGEGSGLGLEIVRKIVNLHQGRIEVESEPGRTTFSVFLPGLFHSR